MSRRRGRNLLLRGGVLINTIGGYKVWLCKQRVSHAEAIDDRLIHAACNEPLTHGTWMREYACIIVRHFLRARNMDASRIRGSMGLPSRNAVLLCKTFGHAAVLRFHEAPNLQSTSMVGGFLSTSMVPISSINIHGWRFSVNVHRWRYVRGVWIRVAWITDRMQ